MILQRTSIFKFILFTYLPYACIRSYDFNGYNLYRINNKYLIVNAIKIQLNMLLISHYTLYF